MLERRQPLSIDQVTWLVSLSDAAEGETAYSSDGEELSGRWSLAQSG